MFPSLPSSLLTLLATRDRFEWNMADGGGEFASKVGGCSTGSLIKGPGSRPVMMVMQQLKFIASRR